MPYVIGYNPTQQVSYSTLVNAPQWYNVHPEVKKRLLMAFRDLHSYGKTGGFGGGFRTHKQQLDLFIKRYSPISKSSYDNNRTNCKIFPYNGNMYWRLNPGSVEVATPGSSYHEATVGDYCVAVDLITSLDYNIDTRWVPSSYGLKMVPSISEPWHVQPVEFPDSKWKYDPNIHKLITWPDNPTLINSLFNSLSSSSAPRSPLGYLSTGPEARKLIVQLKLWGLYDGPSVYGIGREHLYAIKRFKMFINQFLRKSLVENNVYDFETEVAYNNMIYLLRR
jgi:hypothetical protein